ncbi:TRAP transporter small permease [Leucobacter ruminantium]|uniref:TRAP transporter small permease n=1 Tax=Leucobacter ruminantium TaxID=1289170 RepID=A0A939LY82_9MICO|nr:TRAP transporter small permease [Leucobacter ruminantium]MBO1806651.1 TRAP transporter small permease [Leucobacter ruminantium]
MIEKLIRGANLALLGTASAGVLLLAVMVFGGVLWRYVLGAPLSFVLPVGEYVLLAIIFLAMSGTLLNDGHVRIDFVTEAMPRRVGLIVRQAGDAIGIAVVGLLCWLSVVQFDKVFTSGETDISVLRIPMWFTQWLLIFGFGLMTLTYLLLWVKRWSQKDEPQEPAVPETEMHI